MLPTDEESDLLSALDLAVKQKTLCNDTEGAIGLYESAFRRHPALIQKRGTDKLGLLLQHDTKLAKLFAENLIRNEFSKNQLQKTMIGLLIANDEINISKMDDRSTDRNLIVFAYDILTEQHLLFDEQTSPNFDMLVSASLARLLVDMGRTDDALPYLDMARQRALELNDTRMIIMLDEFQF
jgi:hypothetical protein